MSNSATTIYSFKQALQHPEHERTDFCTEWDLLDEDERSALVEQHVLGMPNLDAMVTSGAIHSMGSVRGMGKIYDMRPLFNPNGGKIHFGAAVMHIPVIRNTPGIDDLLALGRVLKAQGLMVQKGNDSEGNIAHFTNFNELCYQARGLNQQSWGVEQMHYSTHDSWTKKQLRSTAYLLISSRDNYGLAIRRGVLRSGNGIASIDQTGAVTHEDVSNKAGYHDRSDPGWEDTPNVNEWEYIFHCVRFYDNHHHFEGA